MAIIATILGIFANPAVIGLAVQLIENFMAKSQASADQRAQMVDLVAMLRTMGLAGLKSRFEGEAAEKQSIDDQWDKIKAADKAAEAISGIAITTPNGSLYPPEKP